MATDLTRLLATESRLAERLNSARAEAKELVAQAEAAAARRESALAAELESEQRLTETRLIQEQREREAEIADHARRQIEAYEHIPAARLAELARTLVTRLLDQDQGP